MKEFLEFLEQNEEAKNRILALKGDPEAIKKAVDIAKEYGFDIEEPAMEAERNARFGKPCSDDELDAVAGGKDCGCFLGGGGSSGGTKEWNGQTLYELTCACVIGGGGEYENKETGERSARCVCITTGLGS